MAFLNLSSLINGGARSNNDDDILLQDGSPRVSYDIKAVELPEYMKQFSFEVANTFVTG